MLTQSLISAVTVAACVSPLSLRLLDTGPVGSQQPIRIDVAGLPRPVSEALRQVERHFAYVVTYEDTSYVHPADIVDVTERVRRDHTRTKRVLVMRPGTITFTLRPQGDTASQVEQTIDEILRRSRLAGNAGDFRVQWVEGGYHVIPIVTRGKSGETQAVTSPLDARITLVPNEEKGLAALKRFADAVSAAAGRKVTLGIMPLSRLETSGISIDAYNDSARDALWRSLQAIGGGLSWQLLCSVGENGECTLNIHPVTSRQAQ